MRDFWDIIKSVIASILVAFFVAIGLGDLIFGLPRRYESYSFYVRVDLMAVSLLLLAVISMLRLFIARRPLRVYLGRELTMKANMRLIAQRMSKQKYILSTRIGYWPVSEDSQARREFREFLTRRIHEGVLVRRIWQIHCKEDLDHLATYLNLYRSFDNYSVKCFVGRDFVIPEILAISGVVVSVSIPQRLSPERLSFGLHFFGRHEIRCWEEYFEIIWDRAIEVKLGSAVRWDKLEEMRANV